MFLCLRIGFQAYESFRFLVVGILQDDWSHHQRGFLLDNIAIACNLVEDEIFRCVILCFGVCIYLTTSRQRTRVYIYIHFGM